MAAGGRHSPLTQTAPRAIKGSGEIAIVLETLEAHPHPLSSPLTLTFFLGITEQPFEETPARRRLGPPRSPWSGRGALPRRVDHTISRNRVADASIGPIDRFSATGHHRER
jgi:hypothetical protein